MWPIFLQQFFLHQFFFTISSAKVRHLALFKSYQPCLNATFIYFGGGVLRCTKRRHTCSRYLSYFWRSFDDDKGDGNEKVNSIVNLRSFKLCRDSKPHPCPEWEPRKKSSRLGKVREFHTSGRSVRGAHYFLLELSRAVGSDQHLSCACKFSHMGPPQSVCLTYCNFIAFVLFLLVCVICIYISLNMCMDQS